MIAMNTSIPLKTETYVDGPVVIERTHHRQTEASLTVLNHIANQPKGCDFDELYAVFSPSKGLPLKAFGANKKKLHAMLDHMHACGYVETSVRKGARLYHLGDLSKLPRRGKALRPVQPKPQTNPAALADPVMPAYVGQRVPPRQYDVMYGPVYVPSPSAAPRAGSLDFMRLASHGYGC